MAKFVRVFLKGETDQLRWIDYPAPVGITNFVLSCKLQGCIMPGNGIDIYVPWPEVKLVIEFETEARAAAPFFMGPGSEGKPN